MTKKMTLMLLPLLLLACGIAQAQPLIGDPVLLENDPLGNPPNYVEQGVDNAIPPADPVFGDYSILVNGWIEAYARVSAWDNWINFGRMAPAHGTFALPEERLAFSTTGAATYQQDAGELGGQVPLYQVAAYADWQDFDIAGIRVETNARLDLSMYMGGRLTRVDEAGNFFAGTDTRRLDNGPYQLRNQVKMVMQGRFLDYVDATNPAADQPGTQFVSPTDGTTTDYNTWTEWDSTANAIPGGLGWFEPVSAGDVCPWLGVVGYATDPGRAEIDFIDLVVERGQAQDSGTGEAAEVWFTQRVLRRGLQDVQGNYRATMNVSLYYRESDVQWAPTVK